MNEFEDLGKWGSVPGKQNLRVTCPKGELEFNFFSSPGLVGEIITKRIWINLKLNECSLTRRTGCQARSPDIFAVNKESNL